jgi:hypothetical protein
MTSERERETKAYHKNMTEKVWQKSVTAKGKIADS